MMHLHTEHSILFIHWYVWIYYLSIFLSEVLWNLMFYDSLIFNYFPSLRNLGLSLTGLVLLAILIMLILSLCILKHKRMWFHIEPAGVNSYKLVYRVVKFAYQHKVPLKRNHHPLEMGLSKTFPFFLTMLSTSTNTSFLVFPYPSLLHFIRKSTSSSSSVLDK